MSNHERDLRLRNAIEREGLGPSAWRERDCVTLVRSVIREVSGQEPAFGLPAWTDGLGEQEAILQAPREHGTLRKCWIELLDGEPLLRRVPRGTLPAPGMVALTAARGFELDRAAAPGHGPLLGVIGPDYALWVRTHDGLRRAYPIADMWEVV